MKRKKGEEIKKLINKEKNGRKKSLKLFKLKARAKVRILEI